MRPRSLRICCSMVLLFLLAIVAASCSSRVIASDQGYVLVRQKAGELAVVADDDPLQVDFNALRGEDRYIDALIDLFEHTTLAYLSTNMPVAHPQMVANHLILVVDSPSIEAQTDLSVRMGGRHVPVELAVGLGRSGQVDLEAARYDWGRALAPVLLGLAGWPVPSVATEPALCDVCPECALEVGLGAALDALHAQDSPDLISESYRVVGDPVARERLARYLGVPENAFRWRYDGAQPTAELRSRQEALQTPGVVATFCYRLLRQTGPYYPQRYMLWFADDYAPDEIAYGKLLLALARAPKDAQEGTQALVDTYCETFPAEQADVRRLADEVFGSTLTP